MEKARARLPQSLKLRLVRPGLVVCTWNTINVSRCRLSCQITEKGSRINPLPSRIEQAERRGKPLLFQGRLNRAAAFSFVTGAKPDRADSASRRNCASSPGSDEPNNKNDFAGARE